MVHRTIVASSKAAAAAKVRWLDLRGSGLSVLERLVFEECLFQTENDSNWVIAGYHEPWRHRYLKNLPSEKRNDCQNESAAIILGIAGKPHKLLNLDLVQSDQIMTIKRFSGGGTVVLDYDSIWTTIIGRKDNDGSSTLFGTAEHFPRPLMEWTEHAVFGPMFQKLAQMQKGRTVVAESSTTQRQHQQQTGGQRTLVMDSKSCAVENTGRVIQIPINKDKKLPPPPSAATADLNFALRENDFVLGEKKMGGNAQSIGKMGWLHHTSFLWDFDQDNMGYLTLPDKRPKYRLDRSHDDFLVKLSKMYPQLTKNDFFAALAETCEEQFELERVTFPQAMEIVNRQAGGLDKWFREKSRTKVVDLLN